MDSTFIAIDWKQFSGFRGSITYRFKVSGISARQLNTEKSSLAPPSENGEGNIRTTVYLYHVQNSQGDKTNLHHALENIMNIF
jgi:hypothetical protein